MSAALTITPLANRLVPAFHYQRMPSLVMPDPIVPDGVLPPQHGIDEIFELRVATDDSTERDAFSVRWQVYCDELGYEPAGRFPDHLEYDAADMRSVSVVAYYRATGMPIGCFRLMLADPQCLAAPFHLEEVCTHLETGMLPRDGSDRLGYTEISRFCIVAPFRRFTRSQDCRPPAAIDAVRWREESQHRQNLASFLWLSAAHLAVHARLDYILALMEPRLQQLARSVGFVFHPIGPGVEFRGLRQPYRIDRRALRALLQDPRTASLLAPLAPAWEAQAVSHPLLVNYLSKRPVPISQRLGVPP